LKNKGLVKTKKFSNPKYIGDPINAVRIFNEKEVDELIFLDIEAGVRDKIDFDVISDIASECFMPLCIGGGIKSVSDIEKLFRIGVEKISINTAAFTNKKLISESSKIFGNQSIIVSIDVKKKLFNKYEVYLAGGKKATGIEPSEYALMMQDLGAGEILLNSIDKDGTKTGFDLGLISQITSKVSVPVIALGGAGNLNDLKDAIVKSSASASAAGSMFVYYGNNDAVLINFPPFSDLQELFTEV
jgi:cyclase